jgi:hypothetical protein
MNPSSYLLDKSALILGKVKLKKKNFIFTCRILEAKLLVNLTKVFQMNVHCVVQLKDKQEKTTS